MARQTHLYLWFCFLLGQVVLAQRQPEATDSDLVDDIRQVAGSLSGTELERMAAHMEELFRDIVRSREEFQLHVERQAMVPLPVFLLVSLSLCLFISRPFCLSRRMGPSEWACTVENNLCGRASQAHHSTQLEETPRYDGVELPARQDEVSIAGAETSDEDLQMQAQQMENNEQQLQQVSAPGVEKRVEDLQMQVQQMEGNVRQQLRGLSRMLLQAVTQTGSPNTEAVSSAAVETRIAELQMQMRDMESGLLQQLQEVNSTAVETKVAERQMQVNNMEGSLLQQLQETAKTAVEKTAGELQREVSIVLQRRVEIAVEEVRRKMVGMEGSILRQLQESTSNAATKLVGLQGQVRRLEGGIQQLRESTSIAAVETKLNGLQGQVRGLEGSVQQLHESQTPTTVETKVDGLRGQLRGLEGTVQVLQESASTAAVETKLDGLQGQVRGLEGIVQQLQETVNATTGDAKVEELHRQMKAACLRLHGDLHGFVSDQERLTCTATGPKKAEVTIQGSRISMPRGSEWVDCGVVGVGKLAATAGQVGSPALVGWKVSFARLPHVWEVFAGVIGNPAPGARSFQDLTAYGWSSAHFSSEFSKSWIAGSHTESGLSPFRRGDSLVFILDTVQNRLRVALVRTGEVEEVRLQDGMAGEARLHLNLPWRGTEIQVSPVTFDEVARAGLLPSETLPPDGIVKGQDGKFVKVH